jgi:alkane 1-monooxygenase
VRFAKHLLCFSIPLITTAYLATGPHSFVGALPWALTIVIAVALDVVSPAERSQPDDMPLWPFDGVLYALVALQLVNVALLASMVAEGGLWRPELPVTIFLVGANSGYSAIVVAHELVHRRSKLQQTLGRLLLVTVLYEHFYTEHVRGHHARVGTADDPATARFGEPFWTFWRRTVPAQFRSAWRIEARRLGDVDMGVLDVRTLRNRVLHGVVAGLALCLAILAAWGPGALGAFVMQAWLAFSFLEAVNWFEHWGLERQGTRVTTVDSWDTDSAFTLYSLVGLSRHADHHANATRPYPQLRHFDESPKLPFGYIAMAIATLFVDGWLRPKLEAELRRKGLGPFRTA